EYSGMALRPPMPPVSLISLKKTLYQRSCDAGSRPLTPPAKPTLLTPPRSMMRTPTCTPSARMPTSGLPVAVPSPLPAATEWPLSEADAPVPAALPVAPAAPEPVAVPPGVPAADDPGSPDAAGRAAGSSPPPAAPASTTVVVWPWISGTSNPARRRPATRPAANGAPRLLRAVSLRHGSELTTYNVVNLVGDNKGTPLANRDIDN